MNAIRHIRKVILGVTQARLAEIAGSNQATVSRWENGTLHPDRAQMARILEHARAANVALSPEDFFAPESATPADEAAA